MLRPALIPPVDTPVHGLRRALLRWLALFDPGSVFAPEDDGAVIDPRDDKRRFEDPAGTIPGQGQGPVGRVEDPVRGNHATQPDAAKRPWWNGQQLDFTGDQSLEVNVTPTANATVTIGKGQRAETRYNVDLSSGVLVINEPFTALTVLTRDVTTDEQIELETWAVNEDTLFAPAGMFAEYVPVFAPRNVQAVEV